MVDGARLGASRHRLCAADTDHDIFPGRQGRRQHIRQAAAESCAKARRGVLRGARQSQRRRCIGYCFEGSGYTASMNSKSPRYGVARVIIMLNKPRGLVTTARDEQGRETVYQCFEGSGLPWLAPVGRLDKASEGLLLFSNDPKWASRVTGDGPVKTYHVQIDRVPSAGLLKDLEQGT